MIRFGSVCSGIEAASVACKTFGYDAEAAWFSEIEPAPSKLLKHHYPEVPNHGDMTLLVDKILSGEVDAPDMLVGGTPCQAFSIAGKRLGLEDYRGNLTLTFTEIANAIDTVRHGRGLGGIPICWENVPGVLSDKTGAFGCLLGALAGYNEAIVPHNGKWGKSGMVIGSRRRVAWVTLDAQYFGVAQRRRRVWVVAIPSEIVERDPTKCPSQILAIGSCLRGDTPQKRYTRKDSPSAFGASPSLPIEGTDRRSEAALKTDLYSIMPMNSGKDYKARVVEVTQPLMTSPVGGNQGGNQGGDIVVGSYSDDPIAFHPTQTPISSDSVCHAIGTGNSEGCCTAAVCLDVAYNITLCDANGTRSDRPDGGMYVNETDTSNTLTVAESGPKIVTTNNPIVVDMMGSKGMCNVSMNEVCPTLATTHNDMHAVLPTHIVGGSFTYIESNQSDARCVVHGDDDPANTVISRYGTGGNNVPLVMKTYDCVTEKHALNADVYNGLIGDVASTLMGNAQSEFSGRVLTYETCSTKPTETYVLDRAAFSQGPNAKFEPKIDQDTAMATIISAGPHAIGRIWPPDVATTMDTAFSDKLGLENQHIDSGAAYFTLQKDVAPSLTTNDPSRSPQAAEVTQQINAVFNATAAADPV